MQTIFLGSASLLPTSLPACDQGEYRIPRDIIAASPQKIVETLLAIAEQLPLAAYPYREAHLAFKGTRAVWDAILQVQCALKGQCLLGLYMLFCLPRSCWKGLIN